MLAGLVKVVFRCQNNPMRKPLGEKGVTQDYSVKGMSNPVLCVLGPFRPGEMVLKKLEAMEYIEAMYLIDLYLKLMALGKVSPSGGASGGNTELAKESSEDSELSSSFLFAELLMCVSRPYVKKHESEQLGWKIFVNYFTRPLTPESDRDYDNTTRANMDTKSVFQEFWNLEKNLKVEIGLSSFEPQSLEVYNPEKSKAHRLWKPVSVLKKELAEEV